MPKDQTFRFRLSSSTGECSQDWRIWAERDELYIGARHTSHEYKASFHSSGQCHVGLNKEIRKKLEANTSWEGKSRLFSKWTIDPSGCAMGRQHLLELVFANSYLDVLETKHEANVHVLESRPGTITTVAVVRDRLAKGTVLVSDAPTFAELHRIYLPSGNAICVLKREFPETPEYHQYVRTRFLSHWKAEITLSGRTYGERPTEIPDTSARALLWDGTNPEKYWHEVSPRKIISLGQFMARIECAISEARLGCNPRNHCHM